MLRKFALLGGEGEYLCRERVHVETRVGFESIFRKLQRAENRRGVKCVERERRARPQRPLYVVLRSLDFFFHNCYLEIVLS